MTFTCPCCFASIPIEAALESASGRELMGVLAAAGPLARPLAGYLGCFRSPTRALAWDRALKLAREVQALDADPRLLAAALAETVEALRIKREQGDVRPLKNHNYLKQVLTSVSLVASVPSVPSVPGVEAVKGRRRLALDALADWGTGSLLRTAIAHGLCGLVAIGRPGTPGADTVTLTADMWLHWAIKQGLVETNEDAERLNKGFSDLVQSPLKEWPEPASLAGRVPGRKRQERLPTPPQSAEEIERNRQLAVEACRRFSEGE